MTIPFWLGVILGAILFWRATVWLGLEDFMGSWKGFPLLAGIMLALVAIVALVGGL